MKDDIKEYLYHELYTETFKQPEDFSPEKIEKIVQTLDLADPKEELSQLDSEQYLTDFYKQNNLKQKPTKRYKKLHKIALSMAAAFAVLLCSDLFVKATFNQTILEVIGNLTNGGQIHIIPQEDTPVAIESDPFTYNSWYDFESATNRNVLTPTYIPKDIKDVSPITSLDGTSNALTQEYVSEDERFFSLSLIIIPSASNAMSPGIDANWTELDTIYILDNTIPAYLYQNENFCVAYFAYQDILYSLTTTFDYDTFEKILLNFK